MSRPRPAICKITHWPAYNEALKRRGFQISDGVIADTTYEAHGHLIVPGRESVWTAWVSARTGNIQLTMADLAADMSDWLASMNAWAGDARDLRDQLEDTLGDAIEAAAQGWLQMQMSERHLRVSIDNVQAEYTERITVIVQDAQAQAIKIEALEASVDENAAAITSAQQTLTTADSALAERIDTVSANLGAASASGTFQVTAEAGPAGVLARAALRLLASTGEAISERQAAMWLEALAGGLSRIALQADRFAIANGDGRVFPFIVDSGNVYMNKAMIGEAWVETLMLARNAVTVPVFATGSTVSGGGTFQSVLSLTLDVPADTPVLLLFSLEQ
ncbi:MAG TPA: hypothetical protein VGC40_07835, partial [Paenirhodobacter sp.]